MKTMSDRYERLHQLLTEGYSWNAAVEILKREGETCTEQIQSTEAERFASVTTV